MNIQQNKTKTKTKIVILIGSMITKSRNGNERKLSQTEIKFLMRIFTLFVSFVVFSVVDQSHQ